MLNNIVRLAASAMLFLSIVLSAQAQQKLAPFAAVPSEKGGQDIFGPYQVDPNWPKDIATLPGHEGWTFGAGQGIFAESPDRIYYLQRGELPDIQAPKWRMLPEVGPSISFPVGTWRSATRASLPGNGGTGQIAEDGIKVWLQNGGRMGVDARWEHCILIFDGEGNMVDAWTQWDSMLQRPHFVAINPYDPEKHVWIIDDHKHVIHKFTHDGKTLLQTIGTYGVPGADATHFNRPTFMDWFPDGSFVVSDGYNGTRVAKFDKDGKFIKDWGQKGNAGSETRPGYWNNVHGIAVDPDTHRVFVNDRGNRRIQVFDEEGKYLYEWSIGQAPSSVHLINLTADHYIWAFDRVTSKFLKYDMEGNFLYSWGTSGNFPGAVHGVHGMSVDQEGTLYVADVDNGGAQKFVPRPGANPDYVMGKPKPAVWR
jgi:6-bladed beta-propeller